MRQKTRFTEAVSAWATVDFHKGNGPELEVTFAAKKDVGSGRLDQRLPVEITVAAVGLVACWKASD